MKNGVAEGVASDPHDPTCDPSMLSGTVAIRQLITKKASHDRNLKFEQLYCINELLANDVLLVFKILLGFNEALWLKKLEISHASQILTNDRQILVLS